MSVQRVRIGSVTVLAVILSASMILAAPATKSSTSAKKSTTSTKKSATSAKKATPDSLQVLARVGKETITRADVNRRLEEIPEQVRTTYTTPEGRQQLLDRIIEEKVWLQMASKNGVGARPEVKRQLESSRRDLLIRTYLNEVMADNPAPGDSEVKAYYDSHLADYRIPATITLRHIQTKTESEGKKMLGWARGNQDFAKLAQKYSTDSLTRASGGMLGSVTHDGMFGSLGAQPALAESAFTLAEGKVGGPFKSSRGWHVLKIDSKHEESVRSYDQVKPVILRQISGQRAQDYYHQRLDEARRSLGVTADSNAIRSYLSTKKSARDMFKEAQESGVAADRIAKYQALLKEYPDSDVSPQAQFMIGFIYSEELKNFTEAEKAFRLVLSRYPKSELAPSAQWMVDHMRTEDAPNFLNLEADSSRAATTQGRKGSTRKP